MWYWREEYVTPCVSKQNAKLGSIVTDFPMLLIDTRLKQVEETLHDISVLK